MTGLLADGLFQIAILVALFGALTFTLVVAQWVREEYEAYRAEWLEIRAAERIGRSKLTNRYEDIAAGIAERRR